MPGAREKHVKVSSFGSFQVSGDSTVLLGWLEDVGSEGGSASKQMTFRESGQPRVKIQGMRQELWSARVCALGDGRASDS